MFERILIATDGSKFGEKAAKVGIELAKLSGGKVIIVYVADINKSVLSKFSPLSIFSELYLVIFSSPNF